MTFSYAATTGLFNLQAGVWDSTLLEAIVGEDEGEKLTYSTERLKCMLGSVEDCECKAVSRLAESFRSRADSPGSDRCHLLVLRRPLWIISWSAALLP